MKFERLHYMAKSEFPSQQITTFMHCTTHTDAPTHAVEDARFMDEAPLSWYFGSGVVVRIRKQKWEMITPEDLENPHSEIRPGDIAIGWRHYYADSRQYFVCSPGTYQEAGE